MSLKSCKYCGRIVSRDHVCDKKPKQHNRRCEEERGRYTHAWERKAKQIKERSQYMCAVCKERGVVTCDGLEVHHIVPLRERPDLLLEDANLICLCEKHHEQAERGGIDRGELVRMAKERDDKAAAYPPAG